MVKRRIIIICMLISCLTSCGNAKTEDVKKGALEIKVNENNNSDINKESIESAKQDRGNKVYEINSDGYTVCDIQDISIDDFPNIVGYRESKSDKRGYTNIIISDNQDKWTKTSDKCTNKVGTQYTRAVYDKHEILNREVGQNDWIKELVRFNEWMEISCYTDEFADSEELENINNESIGNKGQSVDYFKQLHQRMLDIGSKKINIYLTDTNIYKVLFEIYIDDNGEVNEWYVHGEAAWGIDGDEHFTAYYDKDKLKLLLAGIENGRLTFYRYSK